MNIIKKIIPNSVKLEGRYLLYRLLNIPFNRVNLPVDIMQWLQTDLPVTFIDIGASKGKFSASVSKFYKVKKGLLIEPIPANIPILKEQFNDENKFEVVNMAVSDKAGEADFFITEDLDVLSSLYPMKDDHFKPFYIAAPVKTTVKTDTLDHIVTGRNLGIIDLIKLDVQGAEHLVLNSGTQTLKSTKLLYTEFSYKPMYDGSSG